MHWYQKTTAAALAEMGVTADCGLDSASAAARLAEYGPNELIDKGAKSPWRILWEQFTAVMVLILIGAGLLSVALGKANESIAIFAIVILFGLLGFVQEYRAEKAMAALKQMSVPVVRVRRNRAVEEISARDVTVGDIVVLEAGNVVPADLRLIESNSLRIQEAALTGESEPVEKETVPLTGNNLSLGDRRNSAYMGTTVSYGRGAGMVTAVGMNAELGKIAAMLQGVKEEQTPLQQRLDRLGKILAVAGVAIAAALLVLGVLRGEDMREMFLTAVSVAVAIIPEGLPAVVTFTLALGARKMLSRNALIRKLPAVETLGSVTTICSDKTGTLTENRMTVVVLDVAGHRISITEDMTDNALTVPSAEQTALRHDAATAQEAHALEALLLGGAMSNDAQLERKDGRIQTIGDPTEGALLVAAHLGGIVRADMEQYLPRVGEIPFDSDRKRMTTVHEVRQAPADPVLAHLFIEGGPFVPSQAHHVAFTKGSVDGLLDISSSVWTDREAAPLTAAWRGRIEAANAELAANGMRVLGVAFRTLPTFAGAADEMATLERGLTFVGFFGIIDPPRAEVRDAVAKCKSAGIRPVMITGDHPLTARYIAIDLGILDPTAARVMTGADLERMSDDDLGTIVETISVFARVSPEHKLRIVRALEDKGEIVAMTGDGVNDAPALKQADIGVAMGITGTDVSKEAADMVLLDDNFATIVASVEEGRTIYDNVRRFVKYSIAGNIGKVAVMILAPFLSMPIPLLPLQLLWLNLLTDGLLGLGMGFEPAEKDVMRRPPISPQAGIVTRGMAWSVLWVGALIGVLSLGVGYWYWVTGNEEWQTLIFNTLAFAQIGQALASRSTRESLFAIGLFSNKPLLGMIALVVVAQAGVLEVPFFEGFFRIRPIEWQDWSISIAAGMVVFAAIEIEKWLGRLRAARPGKLAAVLAVG